MFRTKHWRRWVWTAIAATLLGRIAWIAFGERLTDAWTWYRHPIASVDETSVLDELTELDVRDESLQSVIATLERRHRVRIEWNDDSLTGEEKVRLQLSGVSLRSVLHHLGRQVRAYWNAHWVPDGHVVLDPRPQYVTRLHLFDRLVAQGMTDYRAIADAIHQAVLRDTLDGRDDESTFMPVPGGLIVCHTRETHACVAELIDTLAERPVGPRTIGQSPREAELQTILEQPTDLEFEALPVDEAAERIRTRYGVPVVVEPDLVRRQPSLPVFSAIHGRSLQEANGLSGYVPLNSPTAETSPRFLIRVRDEAIVLTPFAIEPGTPRVWSCAELATVEPGVPLTWESKEFGDRQNVDGHLLQRTLAFLNATNCSSCYGLVLENDPARLALAVDPIQAIAHLRRAALGEPGAANLERDDQIERRLRQPVSLRLTDATFAEALQDVARQLDVPVRCDDPAALVERGDWREDAVPAEDLLYRWLAPRGLQFSLRHGVLLIHRGDGDLTLRVYRVPSGHRLFHAFGNDPAVRCLREDLWAVRASWAWQRFFRRYLDAERQHRAQPESLAPIDIGPTPETQSRWPMSVRLYPVSDLVGDEPTRRAEQLALALNRGLSPGVDGPLAAPHFYRGLFRQTLALPRAILVRSNSAGHRQVERCLTVLRQSRSHPDDRMWDIENDAPPIDMAWLDDPSAFAHVRDAGRQGLPELVEKAALVPVVASQHVADILPNESVRLRRLVAAKRPRQAIEELLALRGLKLVDQRDTLVLVPIDASDEVPTARLHVRRQLLNELSALRETDFRPSNKVPASFLEFPAFDRAVATLDLLGAPRVLGRFDDGLLASGSRADHETLERMLDELEAAFELRSDDRSAEREIRLYRASCPEVLPETGGRLGGDVLRRAAWPYDEEGPAHVLQFGEVWLARLPPRGHERLAALFRMLAADSRQASPTPTPATGVAWCRAWDTARDGLVRDLLLATAVAESNDVLKRCRQELRRVCPPSTPEQRDRARLLCRVLAGSSQELRDDEEVLPRLAPWFEAERNPRVRVAAMFATLAFGPDGRRTVREALGESDDETLTRTLSQMGRLSAGNVCERELNVLLLELCRPGEVARSQKLFFSARRNSHEIRRQLELEDIAADHPWRQLLREAQGKTDATDSGSL